MLWSFLLNIKNRNSYVAYVASSWGWFECLSAAWWDASLRSTWWVVRCGLGDLRRTHGTTSPLTTWVGHRHHKQVGTGTSVQHGTTYVLFGFTLSSRGFYWPGRGYVFIKGIGQTGYPLLYPWNSWSGSLPYINDIRNVRKINHSNAAWSVIRHESTVS